MARRAIASVVSSGICSFCESEVDKRKMTQHLKHCKQRASTIAQENASSAPKTKIFHLLVEGHYNPQYWMHLEIPASEELATLDNFLRAIWLECCGHLSAFRINGTSYDSEPEEFIFAEEGEVAGEDGEEEEEEGEEREDVIAEDGTIEFDKLLDDPLFEEVQQMLPSDWLVEVKKPRTVDDFVVFAKEALNAIPKDRFTGRPTQEDVENYRRHELQRWFLNLLLVMFEDRSLYVPLGKVLKVSQKFSHEYDFGSTTYLDLKVMSEREGIVQDEDDPVKIMARNVSPTILCQVCGQPATKVASGYFDVESNAYCDKCADGDEDLLPVVNSPRVGVCGYTGGEDWYAGEEDEDEEWDDEEDEE
jgi:hypothetical protein